MNNKKPINYLNWIDITNDILLRLMPLRESPEDGGKIFEESFDNKILLEHIHG